MAARPEAIKGLYNIECALCGCTVKSNMIKLGEESGLPICVTHNEENHDIPRIDVPIQRPTYPSKEPEDKFRTYTTPEEE